MEVLLGSPSSLRSANTPVLANVALLLKASVCSMEVLLNPALLVDTKVVTVDRNAYCQSFLVKKDLATGTHALVTTRLDYCIVGLPLEIQMVQNAAVHMLSGASTAHRVTPTLWELHWFPINFHAQIKMLFFTYKALYGLKTRYLHVPGCALHSSGEGLLCVPSPADVQLAGTSCRTLYVVAPLYGICSPG